ncbi:MAG: DPP IV N-terminal domain-containing protein [Planctomycetota bacterium]|nr:DPP IV N-terminal domain-containing protein [Planctomycetota bacterium]
MMRSLPFFLASILTLLVTVCCHDLAAASRAPEDPRSGQISAVEWSEDGQFLIYTHMKTQYRFHLSSAVREEFGAAKDTPAPPRRRSRRARGGGEDLTGTYVGRPTRGRQYTQVDSPNGRWEAHYENWNVVLKEKDSGEKIAVTISGNKDIHYGTASWVYGEELGQNRAMWWTPNSQKLLFYRFDDTDVQPFHLVTGWSKFNTVHYPEYYPKAGAKNPGAQLMVYDLASQEITHIDVGGGSDEYIYNIRISPDGAVMLVNWTDRLQQHLKVMAIDLETGACRVVVEEQQSTWQRNSPDMRYLADHQRFIWTSERSGYSHYELRNLAGERLNNISSGDFQTAGIDFVDEEQGQIGFRGYSSPINPYYMQYHIADLDGKNHRRVTTLDFHHSSFQWSPDKKWLVAQYEEVNTPPSTALYSSDGRLVAKLAEGDPATAANIAEMFSFRSNDDQHEIYGILYKPKDFDRTRQYPVINSLYGGPGSNEISARYVANPRSENNRGYLVVKVNNRGTGNRGKKFLGAAYRRLGDIDIQDHADAIRMLRERDYVDGERVGIVGFSYGGYMAAMGILKHPDVYTAAVNGSGVTDWRHYDTIYTERYMSTPQLNPDGYDIGRATREDYVKNFKESGGHLLIMHGMVDDNVHPSNAFQLIDALDKGSAPYESRFFPNNGHGLGRGAGKTQWEFFDRVLQPVFKGRRISL